MWFAVSTPTPGWAGWSGWRTVALNVISAGLILLAELVSWLAGFGGWGAIFDAKTATWIMLGVNMLNIVLRFALMRVWDKPNPPPPTEGGVTG
jgi:hypothetical protein